MLRKISNGILMLVCVVCAAFAVFLVLVVATASGPMIGFPLFCLFLMSAVVGVRAYDCIEKDK